MKVGDLVTHGPRAWAVHNGGRLPPAAPRRYRIGIITRLWVGGSASVLFEDGEYDVDEDDLEAISESR